MQYNQMLLIQLFRLQCSMGNSSDFINRSNTKFQNKAQLKYLYQTKMFGANKKSISDFKYSLASVQKKLSYIDYPWANEIISQLQKDQSKLYYQYEEVLIQNCKRDGQKTKIFMSKKLHEIFKKSIQERYKLESSTLNLLELKTLIEEFKHLFMVQSWLHKISALQQIDSNVKCCADQLQECQHDVYENNTIQCTQSDKMCNYLINIACKTFTRFFPSRKQSFIISSNNLQSKQYIEVQPYLSKITRNMCFCDKQKAIQSLQSALKKVQLRKFHKNISFIEKVLQKRQIFSYLFVMREISKIDVEFLWKVFGQKHLKDLKD